MTYALPGFATWSTAVQMSAGAEIRRNATLQIGMMGEVVTIYRRPGIRDIPAGVSFGLKRLFHR